MADVKKIATRESYGNALVELGKKYDNVVVLDADLAAATKTGVFKKAFPERHFDCGIAECNMVDVAAGLSTMGLVPFASSFAMFAAGRAFEQIRNTLGYPHNNVKIGATPIRDLFICGSAVWRCRLSMIRRIINSSWARALPCGTAMISPSSRRACWLQRLLWRPTP